MIAFEKRVVLPRHEHLTAMQIFRGTAICELSFDGLSFDTIAPGFLHGLGSYGSQLVSGFTAGDGYGAAVNIMTNSYRTIAED